MDKDHGTSTTGVGRSGITLHPRDVKKALTRADLAEPFLTGKYRCSPYMACQHGCLYCDGRAERYWVQGDFARDIVVRRNLPDLLAAELPKQRERGTLVIGSGITDVYQPVEAEQRLTRRCAEVLAEHDLPVLVLTKSAMVSRDLDLWARVNERAGFVLMVSLAFTEDTERRRFEPGASSVEARLEALAAFKGRGCAIGVCAMPLVPMVADSDRQLEALYERLAELGPDVLIPGGMTLRPGRQKETFFELVRAEYPDLEAPLREIYGEDRPSGAPRAEHSAALHRRVHAAARRHGLPWLMPHRLYRGRTQLYDEVVLLLAHMRELYGARGIHTSALGRATRRLLDWLGPRKRQYNRHRSWSFEDLDEELRQLARAGDLARVLENDRLASFLSKVVLERKTLDYNSLRLE